MHSLPVLSRFDDINSVLICEDRSDVEKVMEIQVERGNMKGGQDELGFLD